MARSVSTRSTDSISIREIPARPSAASTTWQPFSRRRSARDWRISGLSSTISTRLPAGTAVEPRVLPSAGNSAGTGRLTTKVVPRPSALSTSIAPPWRFTMPQTTARPSPLPWAPLVLKKGSNTRRRVSSDMPQPPSSARTTTWPPSVAVRKVNRPPAGIASSALLSRLRNASRSSSAVPATKGILPISIFTS